MKAERKRTRGERREGGRQRHGGRQGGREEAG